MSRQLVLDFVMIVVLVAAVWFVIARPLGSYLKRQAPADGFFHSNVGYWGPLALMRPIERFIEHRSLDWLVFALLALAASVALVALERTRWWKPMEATSDGLHLRLFPGCPTTVWSWTEVDEVWVDQGGLAFALRTSSGQVRVAKTAPVNRPERWLDWFQIERAVKVPA